MKYFDKGWLSFLVITATAVMAVGCGGSRSNLVSPTAGASGAGAGSAGWPLPTSLGALAGGTERCFQFVSELACFSAAGLEVAHDMAGLPALAAPGNLAATVSGTTVTLTWTAPSTGDPVQSYVIEAGSSSGGTNLANFSTGSTTTTFSAGSVPAGSYYVRVRASNSAGVGPTSNELLLVVGGAGPCSAPGAPGGLTIDTNLGGTVVFTWNAASGSPAAYILEAGSGSGLANLASVDLPGSSTSFTATGVGAGTYFVRVKSRNACGTSGASNEVTLRVVRVLADLTSTFLPGENCDNSGRAVDFAGTAGMTVVVTARGPATTLPSVVLYAPDYATQLRTARASGPGFATLTFTLTETGTHHATMCEANGVGGTLRLLVTLE